VVRSENHCNISHTTPAWIEILADFAQKGSFYPEVQIADFKGIWPDRPIVKLSNAGHFSQEDAPDVLIALLQLFVQAKE
jgi:hypothetical protein